MRTAGRSLRMTERYRPVKLCGTINFIGLERCERFYGRALMVVGPKVGRYWSSPLVVGPRVPFCHRRISNESGGPASILVLECSSPWPFGNIPRSFANNFRNDTKYDIRVGTGVGHGLRGLQFRLLFEHHREQHQAVAQRARDCDAVQAVN